MELKIHIVIIAQIVICSFANAQNTLTLQPDSVLGKDAEIALIVPNNNYGGSGKFGPYAWTQSSILNVVRPLIEFNLSSIPANATIIDAKLSLYYNPNYLIFTLHNGSNALWIRRITSAWNEHIVTWNTQPSTTTLNQVSVPQSLSNTQNYLNLNVTQLVQDMINDTLNSHGFMLQLQNETPYANAMLASSDNIDRERHPKIEITYALSTGINAIQAQNSIKLFPNPSNGSFNVDLDQTLHIKEIRLSDLFGNIILQQQTNNQTRIKIDAIKSGVYILTAIDQDNKTFNKTIISSP